MSNSPANLKINSKKNKISVVIPVFNEEENIRPLYRELKEIFSFTDREYEIIFVNDRSIDNSLIELTKIAHKDSHVRVIDFWTKSGQTAALSAGIDNSSGDIIIPMDGDLQNDPADIPLLVSKIEEGYAVVSGWRKNRQDPLMRIFPSAIANWLIRRVTGVTIHDNGCSLKAYRREIIEGIQLYGEMHRFIFVYASWSGGKVTEVVVNHRPRKNGVSKYGYSRIFKVILDLYVIKFLHVYISRPIHFFGKYAFRTFFIGFIFVIWAFFEKFVNGHSFISTPLPIVSALFFIVGFQVILTGIIAELLMRTYYESQGRKSYRIKNIIGG